MVVYVTSIDRNFKFVLRKEPGNFYGEGSPLKGEYFAIIGKGTFVTKNGRNIEVIMLRKVK